MTSFIKVRVGRLPGRIQELALNGDRTVATALQTAGLDATGYEIRVQGAPATPSSTLQEGDIVLLVKKIKGNGYNYIIVRVGRVPGPPLAEVAVEKEGATEAHAIMAAGIQVGRDEVVFKNDHIASLGLYSPLHDGDTIVVKKSEPATPLPSPTAVVEEEEAAEALAQAGAEEEAKEFASVPGTDAAELRASAHEFRETADTLVAEAEEAGRTARELRGKAGAYEEKASAIEAARTDLESARDRLVSLGVLRPQGEGMLTDILRVFGLRKK